MALPLVLAVILTDIVTAQEIASDDPGGMTADQAAGFVESSQIKGRILGVEDPELRQQLEQVLADGLVSGRSAMTRPLLQRKVVEAKEALTAELRAEGYYAATLESRVLDLQTPVSVQVTVDTGRRYLMNDMQVQYLGTGASDAGLPRDFAALGIDTDGPARTETVLDAEGLLLNRLPEIGYPLASQVDRVVIVDHEAGAMSVTYQVDVGPRARFGPTRIDPMETIDVPYVESFISWQPGEWFDRRKLDRLRIDLLATGLFESVSIRRDSELDANGELPIHLVLQEGKHRSVGLEIYWSTDEGFGGEATWEHRNLGGRQERLTTALRLEEVRQELDIRFRKPRFLIERQTLLSSLQLSVEDTDAYQGPLVNAALGLDRRLWQYWTATISLWAEASELEDYLGERRFDLQGLEFDLRRNSANDPLDPSRGWRMDLSLLPYHISGDDNLDVFQGNLDWRGYLPLGEDSGPVLAVRANFGVIADQDPEVLPANRRFYAGGGSSIRGYALQSVGPTTDSGQPTGGNALVELGAELRFRFGESFGGVLFAEGGNVFDDRKPDPTRELRWAAGAGLRFFTAVGPVRLDVGVPIDPRESDDDFQLYISVGQAF